MPKKRSNKKMDGLADLISQAEAARIRNVSRAAISDLIKRGRLRSITVGGRELVYYSEIVKFEKNAAGRPKTKRDGTS
jgi:excisionase family DNA binding protein